MDKVLDSDYVDMIFKIGTNVGAGNSWWLWHILPELIKTGQVSSQFFQLFKVSSIKCGNLLIILLRSWLMWSFQSDMLFKYIIEESNIDILSGHEYWLVSVIADYFDFS